MSRFYISDGARPGRRSPLAEYATKTPGVGSDILNEAQAIARGRKLVATTYAKIKAAWWRLRADSDIAEPQNATNPRFWLVSELAMRNSAGQFVAGTPIVSSFPSATYGPDKLVDGNNASAWRTLGSNVISIPGSWCGFQFAQAEEIAEVYQTNGISRVYNITACTIQYSRDGVTWTDMVSAALDPAATYFTNVIPVQ